MQAPLPFQPAPSSLRHSRAGFERIPANLSRAELFRYFTFAEEDRREINQCRGDPNKIGFALLLGGVRLTGRFLYDFELVPRGLVAHMCEQLDLEVPLFLTYLQRQPTRYKHFERLKAYLGLRSFAGRDRALIAQHVREQVRAGARLHELLPSAEQMLRAHGIVLPGVTVLQKLIGTARMAAEDEVFVALSGRVDEAHQRADPSAGAGPTWAAPHPLSATPTGGWATFARGLCPGGRVAHTGTRALARRPRPQ